MTNSGTTIRSRETLNFPWALFFLTWLTTFALQHRFDAPIYWLDGGGPIADMSQKAYEGDPQRQVLIVMLGALGAFLLYRERVGLRINRIIATSLFAYIVWIGLSVSWADDPSLTLRRVVAFALMLVFAAGCAARMNADTISVFIAALAALNLIPGVLAELRAGNLHPLADGNRFGGTLHPNLQGASLALAIIVACWWLWRTHGGVRYRIACAGAVLVVFLLMTRSRTSVLALVATVAFSVVIVIARDQRGRIPRLVAALVLAIGLAGLASFLVSSSGVRLDFLDSIRAERDTGDVTELTGRVELWQTCLAYASDRSMLGFGFDGFWSAKRIDLISDELGWPINQAHSAYLDELLSLGVPGVGLYVLLLLGCFVICLARFFRRENGYGMWAALLLFVAIHNWTESINVLPTFPNFVFNLILLQIAIGDRRASEERTTPPHREVDSRIGATELEQQCYPPQTLTAKLALL